LLYVDYCIITGFYILDPVVNRDINYGKETYELGLRVVTVYTFIRNAIMARLPYVKLPEKRENDLIYYLLLVFILYVLVTGVDRSILKSYSVRTSSLYEYAILPFTLMVFYSGNSKVKMVLNFTVAFIYIFQDFYYGGRSSSTHVIFVMALFYGFRFLNMRNILIAMFGLIIVMSFVGEYRTYYTLDGILMGNIISQASDTFFVSDTCAYSYHSSLAQLYTSIYLDLDLRHLSFVAFFISIFTGASYLTNFGLDPKLAVPAWSTLDYQWNSGGEIMGPTFYFWLGWPGVVVLTFATFWFIWFMLKYQDKTALPSLCFIVIISMSTRWMLYNPMTLYRSAFFIFPILYLGCKMVENSKKRKGNKTNAQHMQTNK